MDQGRYSGTQDYSAVMRYLRDVTYATSPPELFDRHLWFYGDVADLQNRWVYGKRSAPHQCFVRYDACTVTGVALALRKSRHRTILVSAEDASGIDGIIKLAKPKLGQAMCRIQVLGKEVASEASRILGIPVGPGPVKFYATRSAEIRNERVREMSHKDEPLLDTYKPRRWPGYADFLNHGVRFFGCVRDGQLLSMCGLTQLTSSNTQIIGAETFRAEDKRKGYSRAVCAMALRQGLEMTPIVTWSTHLRNEASCSTARSLGFQPYFEVYCSGT